MVRKGFIVYLCFAFALLVACKKEEGSTTPSIALIGVSKTDIIEFKDSLFITIEYEDLDGNIGTQDPDAKSLFVQDERYENPEAYHIPPITPLDKVLKVKGTIRVYIPTLIRRSSGPFEKTILSIRLKDRDGNWSNTVDTPLLTIFEPEG